MKHIILTIVFCALLGFAYHAGRYTKDADNASFFTETDQVTSDNINDNKQLDLASLVTPKPLSTAAYDASESLLYDEERLSSEPPIIANAQTSSPYDVLPITDPSINEGRSSGSAIMTLGEEKRFENEGYDAEWSQDTENEIWQAFSNSGLIRSELAYLECRSTLCKIELSHKDMASRTKFFDTLVGTLKNSDYNGEHGSLYNYENNEGQLITRIYKQR